ncbi:MAG: hypothetical protein E7211_09790 [Clostridium lundense]|nr:hypothetical protein [Clostridium lundense]
MRLVKCRKCGTPIMLDNVIEENMFLAMQECNEKARKVRNVALKNSYIQEASQIKKMITQIQHRTTQMEERKNTVLCELSELVHYLRFNKIITDEKLNELRAIAREKAEIANKNDEDTIKKIYGDFESILTNRSKKDPTSYKAIKNL